MSKKKSGKAKEFDSSLFAIIEQKKIMYQNAQCRCEYQQLA